MARKHTQNKIVIHDDYAEIVITDRKGDEKARVKIDIDDIDKVKEYRWSLDNHGYIVNGKMRFRLHRFIMNAPKGKVVDHINGDKLDNRKCNLRICIQADNMKNQKKRKNNKSGYTGVHWYKAKNKWQVYIKINYKRLHLGYYDDLEEAIKVRKEAEKKYFGEYRNKE